MPKRKRGDNEEGAAVEYGDSARVEKKRREVEEHIAAGRKALRRVLVTAKAFEWKKLGKRVKAAETRRNGAAEVARLQKEVEILKDLDMGEVATTHLYKTLLKVKRIVESNTLPEYVNAIPKSSGDDETVRRARENVTARLYNFKAVKENMAHIMASMYSVLGIQNSTNGPRNPKIPSMPEVTDSRQNPADEEESVPLHDDSNEDSFGPFDEESDDKNVDSPESEESEDYSRYDGLLAASSDEESEDDEGSDDELRRPIDRPTKTIKSRGISVSVSGSSRSPSPSLSLSQSPEPDIKEKSKPQAKAKGDSTFLPSLMGGYWSGSEEFVSDDESGAPAARKNRPGQRARQAIWEKKYGKKAKHLQEVKWDPKRGAVGPDDRKSRKKGERRGFPRNTAKFTGENAVPVKPRAPRTDKQPEGPLHPSWEAKKKAKEAQKTATFQGSKVVFD